jgi:hypothetical protein
MFTEQGKVAAGLLGENIIFIFFSIKQVAESVLF